MHTRTYPALFASTALLFIAASTHASEEHFDMFISASGGTLVTNGYDHDADHIAMPGLRVFGAEFGEDPRFPFAAFEPGLLSDLIGSSLTLTMHQGLRAWDGGSFTTAFNHELFMDYGGQTASSTVGGGLSFDVGSGLHVHPAFILGGEGADPTPGIYLAEFTVSGTGFDTSMPFWLVFNLGMGEKEHEAAFEWVETNLVPAPGAMLVFMGLAARARSRTRPAHRSARS